VKTNLTEGKAAETRRRVIASAIRCFSDLEFKDVSLAMIAAGANMVPQGLYRYFTGKTELYMQAWKADVEELQAEVLNRLSTEHLSSITGQLWPTYQSLVEAHPLAQKVMSARNSADLDLFAGFESTSALMDKIEDELVEAQRIGILRQDQDFRSATRGTRYLATHVLLPMIFDGKYMSSDWQDTVSVLIGNMFYPIPDLSTPEKVAEYERQVRQKIELARAD